MKGGKAEVLAEGRWLRESREALGASTRAVAVAAQKLANRQGDPIIIHQQQLSGIENATEDKGPAKLPPWFRYVRAAIDSGIVADMTGAKPKEGDAPAEDEYLNVFNSAGEIVGRLTLFREKLQ